MKRVLTFVLAFVLDMIGWAFHYWLAILLFCFVGWLLCDINPGETYNWYSGIWHGWFIVPNFIRSLFSDALYKADYYSTAYNIFYWISSIITVFSFIFGRKR